MNDHIAYYRKYSDGPLARVPFFEVKDPRFVDLASWLTGDIQNDGPDCLLLLSSIEDVRSGRKAIDDAWDGNSYHAEIRPSGVTAESLYIDGRSSTYTLEEVHAAALQYWRFLSPTPEDRASDLVAWEAENHRPHPCGPHLETEQ